MEYEYIMQLLANQTIFNITCIVFIISNIIWISKQFLFLRMESHSENNPRQRVKATATLKGEELTI